MKIYLIILKIILSLSILIP